MAEIVYSEIHDARPLIRFFIENGLEYTENDEIPTDLVKIWKAEETGSEGSEGFEGSDGRLVGACVLAKREGRYICDGIATDPSVRGLGVGKSMLLTMLDEVRKLGGDSIYLVARAPGFFTKFGFMSIERDDAPTFFECFTCPQYKDTCFPEVMRLEIESGTEENKD